MTAAAYESEPYSARPGPDVANGDDSIYSEGGSSTIVAVTPGEDYAGAVTLGVRRA